MTFDGADAAIRDMNKRNLRLFDRLKTLKFDELNVVRSVGNVYRDSAKLARRRFLTVAWEAFVAAMVLAGIERSRAEREADDSITEDWVLDMLEDYDPVTLYQFTAETERKRDRLIEALLASNNKNEQIEKALRAWAAQLAQYADNSVIRATIDGYEKAGVRKVRWVAEKDGRVCTTCSGLDGAVFEIDKVPDAPHFRCRCVLTPIKD